MKAHKLPKLTVEEYVNYEIESDTKYEYHDGKIYALGGGTLDHAIIRETLNHTIIRGTLNHSTIGLNVNAEMRERFKNRGSDCQSFNNDIKLFIEFSNSYVYPDSMVICGEIEMGEKYKESVTNPVLIVEVLSKSTASYDRGDKFYMYRQIPSFKEYVLIEQDKYVVDVHYKSGNSDLWSIKRYEGLDSSVKFESLDIEISMKDLYYKTKITPSV